ncbi:MAG: hypothetical protein HY461_00680, partial [Parcubacteria group bacterium]|nr:hypothetical protein [Parcubacteria group bacterium]
GTILENKTKAIILGNFKNYERTKYKDSHKNITDVFVKFFPDAAIIKTDLFGHDQKCFHTLPIGARATITPKLERLFLEK